MADKKSISRDEARSIIEYDERMLHLTDPLSQIRPISEYWATFSLTDDIGEGIKLEYGATVKVQAGQYSNFVVGTEPKSTYSAISGVSGATWDEYYMNAHIVSASTLRLSGRGAFEYKITKGSSSGISVSALEALGFTVSETIGTTTYYRLPYSFFGDYKMAWAR